MNYKTILDDFFSTCDGPVLDVFFSAYSILESIEAVDQPAALMYVCENALAIETNGSQRIEKNYYNDEQLKRANKKINQKFLPALDKLITECSKQSVTPQEFYGGLWELIQSPILSTKRERAYAVFRVIDHRLIPYRSVGTGVSMDEEMYNKVIDTIDTRILEDTEYILQLRYEQRTQRASLLLDKLLSLKTREQQVAYMAIIMNEIENKIRDKVKLALEKVNYD